jgi:hypothetical protein
MKRTQIPSQERSWRSQLARLISYQPFLRANLQVRQRVCGKHNCHCVRGEKHSSLYLTRSRDGVPQQLFVPRDQEDEVRQWVANYQKLSGLLERISDAAWKRVGKKKEF